MDLAVEKQALKKLARMPPKLAQAFREGLRRIAADPFAPHRNVERLKGRKDAFRFRVGDFRALYRIDRDRNLMIVEIVAARGDAYK
jgi:mRNA interferase RelE/StbE